MANPEINKRVTTLIGAYAKGKENIIDTLIQLQTEMISLYLNTESIPPSLEFVVVETVIARFNRLGSEGYEDEKIDTLSKTFSLDLLEPYKPFLDSYIRANSDAPTTSTVKFK